MSGSLVHPRVGTTEDPLWLIAFPVYFAFMGLYGVFATFYYLPSFRAAASNDPTAAQFFGILIVFACIFGFVGSLVTIKTGHELFELIGDIAVAALMAIYFLTLLALVALADPGTRPGAMFVPMVFAVFPVIRAAVILRKRHRLPRRRKAG